MKYLEQSVALALMHYLCIFDAHLDFSLITGTSV